MSDLTTQEIIRKIWRQPSNTFNRILADKDNPYVDSGAMIFVGLAGIGFGLDRASLRSLGDTIESYPTLVIIASVAGFIGAYIGLYFWSWLFSITNKWLKGTGDFERIKTVLAWASVPFAFATLFWIPELLLFGMENFTTETPRMESNLTMLMVYLGVIALEFIFAIYCTVIWFKGVGRACNFSAWKALLTAIISALMIIVPIIIIVLLLMV